MWDLTCVAPPIRQAQHLLHASDFYGLLRLRAICERTLCDSLSVENVAFALMAADAHHAVALKRKSLIFAANNAIAVMANEGWAHLRRSHPWLADAVMHTLASGAPPDEHTVGATAADTPTAA